MHSAMDCSIYASYSGEPGLARSGWLDRVTTNMITSPPTIVAKISQSRGFMAATAALALLSPARSSCQKLWPGESRNLVAARREMRGDAMDRTDLVASRKQ